MRGKLRADIQIDLAKWVEERAVEHTKKRKAGHEDTNDCGETPS